MEERFLLRRIEKPEGLPEKEKEITKKIEEIRNKIEKRTGRKFFPEIEFFEKEPGRKDINSLVRKKIKEGEKPKKILEDLEKYLAEESIFSRKVWSRLEEKKIYLNLYELKKFPVEAIYPIFHSVFIIAPQFGKKILPELEKELEKEDKKRLKMDEEMIKSRAYEFASFVFTKNFLPNETIKKNLEEKLAVVIDKKNYTLSFLKKRVDKEIRDWFLSQKYPIPENYRPPETIKNLFKEMLVDLTFFLKEAEIVEDTKELQKKIKKEIKEITGREDFKEGPQVFSQLEEISNILKEKIKKEFLEVDLQKFFPPEVLPEFLAKVLEPKVKERSIKQPELERLLEEIKKAKEISPELLEKVKDNFIITEEDIKKAEAPKETR